MEIDLKKKELSASVRMTLSCCLMLEENDATLQPAQRGRHLSYGTVT
jgi:hypothetical protein